MKCYGFTQAHRYHSHGPRKGDPGTRQQPGMEKCSINFHHPLHASLCGSFGCPVVICGTVHHLQIQCPLCPTFVRQTFFLHISAVLNYSPSLPWADEPAVLPICTLVPYSLAETLQINAAAFTMEQKKIWLMLIIVICSPALLLYDKRRKKIRWKEKRECCPSRCSLHSCTQSPFSGRDTGSWQAGSCWLKAWGPAVFSLDINHSRLTFQRDASELVYGPAVMGAQWPSERIGGGPKEREHSGAL